MDFIRSALPRDASRIAEIIITNYRVNFYPFFKNDKFYVVKGLICLKGAEIEKLYVEPKFQGQGIGAKLLSFACTRKNSQFLYVLKYNKRAIAFYKRNGFALTGEKIIEDELVPLLKMSRNIGIGI